MEAADLLYLRNAFRDPDVLTNSANELPAVQLRSGRCVELRSAAGQQDHLTVTSPEGEVELRVVFTPEGPILKFESASLDLEATRDVSMRCDRFEVKTRRELRLESDRTVAVRGEGTVSVDGSHVLLNCESR